MIHIIVGIAGILGALARYYFGLGVDTLWHHPFPLDTLLTNLLGCFLLAWLMAYTAQLNILSKETITGIGTGFLGAFTTFSHFSEETAQLLTQHSAELAYLYVALSVLCGLLMSAFGYLYGKHLLEKRNGTSGGIQ